MSVDQKNAPPKFLWWFLIAKVILLIVVGYLLYRYI